MSVASTVSGAGAARVRPRRIGRRSWAGWLYVLPSLLILLLIAVGPIIASGYLSFTQYDVLSSPQWVGGANYQRLMSDPNFWSSLKITSIFTVIAVPLQVIIPMVLADFLAKHTGRRFSQITRSVLFVPVVASMILVGTVWVYMLSPNSGFFNAILNAFGLESANFLGNPGLALLCVSLVSVWKNIGYFLVLFYAGVMDIPEERYEAAEVDGANAIQRLLFITIPGLKPVILLCVILSTIWSFQVFDLVYAMTGGGPGGATTTLVMSIYQAGFQSFQMGYASAIAMVLLVIIVVVSVIQRLVFKED